MSADWRFGFLTDDELDALLCAAAAVEEQWRTMAQHGQEPPWQLISLSELTSELLAEIRRRFAEQEPST